MQADKLIQHYKERGHLLGEALHQDDLDDLVSLLRSRLGVTEAELNLAPYSLKRLESRLRAYHQELQDKGQQLTDDEVVQLVREIAAYLGIVLLRHAQATWRGGNSLRNTSIEIAGPIKVIKGSHKYTGRMLIQQLGNEAASAWDAVTAGSPPILYSTYLIARRKVAKE